MLQERNSNGDLSWVDLFESFLDETCRKFDNMLICGDLNLAKVPLDCPDSSTGANEQRFVDIPNDHFLIQRNSSPTRGNNVLDLAISSVPDQVRVTEVMEPNEAEMLTDHCIVSFELASAGAAKTPALCLRLRTLEETSTCSVLHFKA